MLADQMRGSGAHASFIEWLANPADATGSECRTRRAIQDHVAIGPRESAVARMERVGNLTRPYHTDLGRELGRRTEHPAALGACGGRVEMNDLHRGVYAGIGAAGGRDCD